MMKGDLQGGIYLDGESQHLIKQMDFTFPDGQEGRDVYKRQACYGSYFLETAAYFAQENLDGTELLKLLYQSLRALLRPALPNRLDVYKRQVHNRP